MLADIPRPILPREHGAWAVLFVPMAAVAFYVQEFPLRLLLLIFSALMVFLSYLPMQILLRSRLGQHQDGGKLRQAKFWGPAYLAAGIGLAVPLIAAGYWLLLPMGLVGALCFLGNFLLTRHYPKTIAGDLLAIFGLSLSAPSSYYVIAGTIDDSAIMIRLLTLFYFFGTALYVHMKMAAAGTRKPRLARAERLSMGKWNLTYYLVIFAVLCALVTLHRLHIGVLLAFTPMTLHAVIGTVTMLPKVRFKNLGFLLLAHSIIFGIVLGMAR